MSRLKLSPQVPCPFCEIARDRAPAEVVCRWPEGTMAIRPLNPVVDGHVLVIPRGCVGDALEDQAVTGLVMQRAVELGRQFGTDLNLITSVGPAASQTVAHFHIHIVPRFAGDGITLPWTGRTPGGKQ